MEETKVIESKQWTLKLRDLLRGGILAAITPVFTIILQSLQAEELTVNWKSILNVAIIAFCGYMLKNLGEPTKIIIPTPNAASAETKEAIKKVV